MKNWFVVQTKPLKEAIVKSLLREAGMRVYYPLVKEEDGRVHALFPCYEFVYFDYPSQYRLVRYTWGVRRIVGNERIPIPVGEAIIQEIKAREVDGFIILEENMGPPEPGDLIEVTKGPFRGLKGIFQKSLSSKERVQILLHYLNYQGKLIIDRDKIRRARPY